MKGMSSLLDNSPGERSRWRAVLAESVVPGWGQWYLGNRLRSRLLFVVDVFVLTGFVVALGWFQLEVVKAWVSAPALIAMTGLNLVFLLFRAMVTYTAFTLAPSEPVSTGSVLGISAAAIIVVVPHLVVGYLAFTQYDLIDTVFAESEPIAAPPATTTTLAPTTSAMEATTSTTSPTTTTIPPTTTTTEPPIWDGLDRLNVVLLGADAGEGRTGVRTDTTIVVSIDPQTGDTVMIGVPRDLSGAPLPPEMGVWGCDCFPDLITHLYDAAERNPDAFPGPAEPPFNAIKGALGEIFGVPMHYYAMVTLDGFVGVVDALGGVTIDVPRTIVDETYPHEDGSTESVVIEEGTRHLDGHLALAYARIRRHSDDFARMHRQRCVLGAIVEQTGPVELIASFGELANAVKENVTTDIPRDRLVDFVDLLPRVSTDRIATLRITRSVYQTGSAPGRVYYDIQRIRSDARALMNDPDAAQEALGLGDLDTTCEKSFD